MLYSLPSSSSHQLCGSEHFLFSFIEKKRFAQVEQNFLNTTLRKRWNLNLCWTHYNPRVKWFLDPAFCKSCIWHSFKVVNATKQCRPLHRERLNCKFGIFSTVFSYFTYLGLLLIILEQSKQLCTRFPPHPLEILFSCTLWLLEIHWALSPHFQLSSPTCIEILRSEASCFCSHWVYADDVFLFKQCKVQDALCMVGFLWRGKSAYCGRRVYLYNVDWRNQKDAPKAELVPVYQANQACCSRAI